MQDFLFPFFFRFPLPVCLKDQRMQARRADQCSSTSHFSAAYIFKFFIFTSVHNADVYRNRLRWILQCFCCFSKVIFFLKSIYDHTYNLSLKLAGDSAVFLLQNKLSCIFFDFHTQVTWV